MSPSPDRPDPALFGESPSRDARFREVERWVDCVNLPEGTPEQRLEFFHRQMNEELNVLENAARDLAEFPEVDWSLRLWLARQCSDEARHALNYRRILERRGGRVGQYPILNFQYRILGKIPTLIGRLAIQNRTFEADGLDAVTFVAEVARREGDTELAEMYEMQQCDEVVHVRFANEWIRQQVEADPRQFIRLAKALDQGRRAFEQVFAQGGMDVSKYGVAETERLEAGFAPEEVRTAVELTEARREAVRARAGSPAESGA